MTTGFLRTPVVLPRISHSYLNGRDLLMAEIFHDKETDHKGQGNTATHTENGPEVTGIVTVGYEDALRSMSRRIVHEGSSLDFDLLPPDIVLFLQGQFVRLFISRRAVMQAHLFRGGTLYKRVLENGRKWGKTLGSRADTRKKAGRQRPLVDLCIRDKCGPKVSQQEGGDHNKLVIYGAV